jgi:hypothetical protein
MTTEQILKIASPFLALILGAIIRYFMQEKSKLISFIGHISSFTIQGEEKPWSVFTHSVIVRNAGRKAAHNVRLGHNYLPQNIAIYPQVEHSVTTNADRSGEIVIPVLVPKEQVTISYLYYPPVTWDQINNYTKSDEGLAKVIHVMPMPQPSKWLTFIVWCLIFIGVSFLLYWLMIVIRYII